MATPLPDSAAIDELDLPMRTYNALRRNNIESVGDLLALSDADFLRMRHVGDKALSDLKARLAARGMALGSRSPVPSKPALQPLARTQGLARG